MQKIYLDQAATSFPKAPGTAEAVYRYMTECGCNTARGSYSEAYSAEETVYDTRVQLCRLLGGRNANRKTSFLRKTLRRASTCC